MHFLIYPPLWFLRGSPPATTSVDVCVSVIYKASIGVDVLDSVDLELSSLAYGFSARFVDFDEGEATASLSFASVQAGIDLDDNAYSTIDLKASITPVYQLTQSGETPVCVSAVYKVSVSVTASIGYNVTPSVTYQLSASLSAAVIVFPEQTVCVSVDYRLSIAPFVLVDAQAGSTEVNLNPAYGVSVSINPQVREVNRGGLVYSRKKRMYIAVRVGPFASA